MGQPNTNTFAPTHSTHSVDDNFPELKKGASVIVIGAGAFGGWSALYLLRKGYKVTLIDAWGAGNSRSSSGDETRVIRSTYGANELYFDLNVRSLSLWKENQQRFGKQLFFNSGVLWFCYEESAPLVDDSIPFSKKNKMEYEYLDQHALRKKYPLLNCEDLHHAYFDPYGGYLKARESCQAVQSAFIKEGGNYLQHFVTPGKIEAQNLQNISLSNGEKLIADAYLFACGAWLGSLFPTLMSNVITCTKQEVYYFGVPAHHTEAFEKLPAWIDLDGKDYYYGIPSNSSRGFKIGVDKRGEAFDPSNGERKLNDAVLHDARTFISKRFPALKNAPLLENRVCPYENSPDGNFIFELHPAASNTILLGGGSGHGFKHGPALGELVSNVLAGEAKVPSLFRKRL